MKKHKFAITLISLIVVSIILIVVLQYNKSLGISMEPIEDQKMVYLGDEDADNELLLVFDYSCDWCTTWMNDVFPELESKYIESGELKFRTQSMVFLNEISHRLADFDQNVKDFAGDQYYEIFNQIIADTPLDESNEINWGSEAYIDDLIDTYQLDAETIKQEPAVESVTVTERYAQDLAIEIVPTVYVNGIKVESSFDLEEIEQLIK